MHTADRLNFSADFYGRRNNQMEHTMKKLMSVFLVAMLVFSLSASALACTAIYVGADLSADGSTVFARSEDYSNSQNKLFYVSPAGNHTAGEVYSGCYGFTWTFTHDSYSYTAFSDDNGTGVGNICPDCGGDHVHSPYEAAGTNEMGISITATETIYGCEAIEEADPFEELGIEEAEIVTVLLSEASSAKEALDLLLEIYDTAGANNGSGILIGDSKEVWYVENVSGHQYIALKLTDSMIFVQPNMSIIGAVDLDDAENVIASDNLIATAQKAGTFFGDLDANIIDYVASYSGGTAPNARMVNALSYLDTPYDETSGEICYLISNIDDNGQIVSMYTNLKPAGKMTIEDVQNFYKIDNIGYVRNLETHIFQISGSGKLETVEWVAMNDAAINVFVPYYPMLTSEVDASYGLSTAEADFTPDNPAEGLFYPTSINQWIDGEKVATAGYMTLPGNWKDSYYWSVDALSNLIMYTQQDSAAVENVYAVLAEKQAELNASFADFSAQLADEDDLSEAATAWSMEAAADVHTLAVALVDTLDLIAPAK